MSLIQELADRLRSTRDGLPVAGVTAAAARMRTAQGLFAWVMDESSRPGALPGVRLAADRLDHAVAALHSAQEALNAYCLALGMAVDARPGEVPPPVATAQPVHTGDPLAQWWGTRISQLSGYGARERGEPITSSAGLLAAVVSAALHGDAKRLHGILVAAGPAVGLGLADVAPPLLRHLAGELLGHAPRLEDLARVRRAALPIVGEVLPDLPADAAETVEEIIARACHAGLERQSDQPAHPVDVAAASAVLVAGMLRANEYTADDLSKVATEVVALAGGERQRLDERSRSPRTALRITGNARRRSAVDELRPAGQ